MLRIKEAIVVEGRYDKNALSQVVDTLILATGGFHIFKDPEQLALLRRAAEFCVSLGEAVKLVQLLPYHAAGKGKYKRLGIKYMLNNVEPPDETYMQGVLELFESFGLNCQIH